MCPVDSGKVADFRFSILIFGEQASIPRCCPSDYDINRHAPYGGRHRERLKHAQGAAHVCQLTSEENLLVAEGTDGGAVGDEKHGLLRVGRKETVVQFALGGFVEGAAASSQPNGS